MTVRPAKTQISLGICPVWSESSLSAWRKLGSLATHWAHSEGSDQAGRMPRLTWHIIANVQAHHSQCSWHKTSLACYRFPVKTIWVASWQNQQMSVRPAKTQISLGIRPIWSESSLCAQWVAKDPSFLHADSEDSDQIWVFVGYTVTLLVLSCRGSYVFVVIRIDVSFLSNDILHYYNTKCIWAGPWENVS